MPLSSEKWNRVYDAFHRAMQLPKAERLKFTREVFDGDRIEVEHLHRLLQLAENESEGRLAGPAAVTVRQLIVDSKDAPVANDSQETILPRSEIGAYRIVTHLGTGGMGEVYLAERKEDFDQQVALKLLRSDRKANRTVFRRFELERELLSQLRHENIAQLLDGGKTSSGIPYFAMEYVDGKPITSYCRDHRLSLHDRIRLFQSVCRAVAHAHHFGVVHRDLKPANILVTPSGVPKLLDFGIARLTEDEAFRRDMTITDGNQTPFTPAYASPEQFKGEPTQVASDIYSLGVVLYELLTGVRPFDTENLSAHEIARLVCEHEPTKPSSAVSRVHETQRATLAEPSSRLKRRLLGDLDQIVLKMLRSNYLDRYSSVEAVHSDLHNYFEGHPVIARRGTTRYFLGKFLRRNAVFVSAAVLVMMAVVGGLIATSVALHRANEFAVENRELLYRAELANAQTAISEGQLASAFQILSRHIPNGHSTDLRGFEWYHLWRQCIEQVDSFRFPDIGGEILSLRGDPPELICTSASNIPRVTWSKLSFQSGVPSKSDFIDFEKKGRFQHHVYWEEVPGIACAFDAGLAAHFQTEPMTTLALADIETGEVLDTLDYGQFAMTDRSMRPGPIAFSPDATLVACRLEGGVVLIFRVSEDRKLEFVHRIDQDSKGGWQITFSPDGSRFAATSNDQTIRIWDTDRFEELLCIRHPGLPYCMCWTPDGTRLISGAESDGIKIWDTASGVLIESHLEGTSVQAISISPNGQYLAVGGKDRIVRLLDLSNLSLARTFLGHNGFVESLAFTADNDWLVSGDDSEEVRLWRVPTEDSATEGSVLTHRSWQGHNDWISDIAFHPNRNIFVTSGHDRRVHVWDGRDGRRIDSFVFDTELGKLAFSPDGKELAIGAAQRASFVWDFDGKKPIVSLEWSMEPAFHASGDWLAEFDPDLRIVHYPSLTDLSVTPRTFPGDAKLAWANRNLMIAFSERNGRVRIGRIQDSHVDWQEVLAPSTNRFESCTFSPDDGLLVLGDFNGTIHWYDMRRSKIVGRASAHLGSTVVTFSPDGCRLATAGRDGTVKLWDASTRRLRLTLKASPAGVKCIDFSPDGQNLVAGAHDGQVILWRAATAAEFENSLENVHKEYTYSDNMAMP